MQHPPHHTTRHRYFDPRTVLDTPRRSVSLTRSESGRGSTKKHAKQLRDSKFYPPEPPARQTSVWNIAPLAKGAFKSLAWKLASSNELPAYGRGHPSPNRYKDILPTIRTRVQLAQLGGDMATTYINANWVKCAPQWGVNFIAAQGPTPPCVPSFVRMIWETGCQCVVMTTNLIEGPKTKCERYWPDAGTMTIKYPKGCAPITLAAVKKVQMKGYIRQELTITQGKVTRKLVHFWYNTWPDHGVPRTKRGGFNVNDLLEMLGDVRAYEKTIRGAPPTLVHCSAGIGRTGTYIGLFICTKLLELTQKVDIVKIVDVMRDDRGGLVQHQAQLSFLHEAVTEYAKRFGKVAREPDRTYTELGTIVIDGCSFNFISGPGDMRMSMMQARKQGMTKDMFKMIDFDATA